MLTIFYKIINKVFIKTYNNAYYKLTKAYNLYKNIF